LSEEEIEGARVIFPQRRQIASGLEKLKSRAQNAE
jgi:hypothetical protein